MEKVVSLTRENFKEYFDSFLGLTEEQHTNFDIKYEHSLRVADLCVKIAASIQLEGEEQELAHLAGLYHDIGRFKQLVEYNTFNDSLSVDHAAYSVEVLKDKGFVDFLSETNKNKILMAIQLHNKFELPKESETNQLLYARILRDADKLDILKVITDYYTNPKAAPNHTLTWEMPKGGLVSPVVARQVLNGSLVSKTDVANETDIKIMQLSWVYDLNFKPSFKMLVEKRYLEKIYSTLPKNDTVIQIYRKVKVFVENKLLS